MLEVHDINILKARLAALLYEKAYMEGDFTLSSGRKSDFYFDCRQGSLNPDGAWLIGAIFLHMLQDMQVAAVAGMTMGGDPLVTATSLVAYHRNIYLPALIVRKEAKAHGAGHSVEGLANVKKGERVVVLEDVVSTGASVLKAADSIEQAGLEVASIFCILNREEPGGMEAFAKAGRELRSVFTRKTLVDMAKEPA